MLSEAERRILVIHCFDHVVATCGDCHRDFKFSELGVDVLGRRYYFCPSCRLELLDVLRLHFLGCRAIGAALEERTQRSEQLMKDSDRRRTASAVLAAESHARAQRILEAKWGPRRPARAS